MIESRREHAVLTRATHRSRTGGTRRSIEALADGLNDHRIGHIGKLFADGKIVDNWVKVDFTHVAAQLGVDVFIGEGWEAFDRCAKQPTRPDNQGRKT